MKDLPLISIVITNFNGGVLLLNCLDSVFKSTYDNFEVIVVDNASTDSSHIKAKKKFPEIILIQNKENLGATGRNSGILAANGEYIVLLDNDTKVQSNWLVEFLKNFQLHGYGMYQGKLMLMDEPKKINSAGCMINIFGFSYAKGSGEIDSRQYDKDVEINFPATACAFIPRKIFDQVGLFDTEFFAYLDDTDFGWRALCCGIKSYFAPSVIVYHKWSSTTKWSPKKFYLLEKNRQICIRTIYSKRTFNKLLLLFKLVDFGVSLLYLKKGVYAEKKRADNYIKKHKSYLEKRYSQLQKKRTVNDKKIIERFAQNIQLPEGSFQNVGILNSFLKKGSNLAKTFLT